MEHSIFEALQLGYSLQNDDNNATSARLVSSSSDTPDSSISTFSTRPTDGDLFRFARSLPSISEDLYIWRTSKEVNLYPLVVINALCMLMGVVGNSTVCYVCAIRMPRTVLNNFVLSLAIAELLGCVFIIPLEITKTMNAYSFDYPKLCKTEKFLRSFVIFFTNCILIAIATERYQRIVKPHERHVTMAHFRLIIAGTVIFATIASIPEAILAGLHGIKNPFGNGVVCSTFSSDLYARTVFPPLWACFVVLVYVMSTAAIGSIYCVISATIWKGAKLQTDRRSRTPNTPVMTLRRRTQNGFHTSNNPSTAYLPHHQHHHLPHIHHHHHPDLSKNSGRQSVSKSEFSRDSYELLELDSVSRPDSNFGLLNEPYSSGDNPGDSNNIKVEVHHPSSPINNANSQSREINEETLSPSWFPHNNASPFIFEHLNSDHQNQSPDEAQQHEDAENCTSHCDSVLAHNIESQTHKKSFKTFLRNSSTDPKNDNLGSSAPIVETEISSLSTQLLDQKHEPNDEHRCYQLHLHQQEQNQESHQEQEQQQQQQLSQHNVYQPDQKRKDRRRFTAAFFDELYQTISRRRQRQEEAAESEFFDRQGSTEDMLAPPPLTPMGSLRSRSGYSRKRTTFIMFIMTTTTAMSLFPHMVVLLVRIALPNVEFGLSPDASILFHIASNSFFISLACHPYVYGFWNRRFKKALISLFDGLRRKTKSKRRRLATRDNDTSS